MPIIYHSSSRTFHLYKDELYSQSFKKWAHRPAVLWKKDPFTRGFVTRFSKLEPKQCLMRLQRRFPLFPLRTI